MSKVCAVRLRLNCLSLERCICAQFHSGACFDSGDGRQHLRPLPGSGFSEPDDATRTAEAPPVDRRPDDCSQGVDCDFISASLLQGGFLFEGHAGPQPALYWFDPCQFPRQRLDVVPGVDRGKTWAGATHTLQSVSGLR